MYEKIINELKKMPQEVTEAYVTTLKGIRHDSHIDYLCNGDIKVLIYPDASEAVKHYDWWCVTDNGNEGRGIVNIIPAHKEQKTVRIAGGDGWRSSAHDSLNTYWGGEKYVIDDVQKFETQWSIPNWVGEKLQKVDFEPLWFFLHFPENKEVTFISGGYVYSYSQKDGLIKEEKYKKYLRFMGYVMGDYETFVSPDGIAHKIVAQQFRYGELWFQTEERRRVKA